MLPVTARLVRLPATALGPSASRGFSSSAATFALSKRKVDALQEAGYPVPPTAPPAAFNLYHREYFSKHRDDFLNSDGKVDVKQAAVVIGDSWKALSPSEKSKYESEAKRTRANFEKEYEAFGNRLEKGDLRRIEDIVGTKLRVPGGRKALLQKTGDSRISGYILFSSDLRSKGAIPIDANADAREKISAFSKGASKAWNALSEDEKATWNARAKKD